MSDYRCYFLRQATTLFGAPTSVRTIDEFTTDEFSADTDEQARLMVELLYQMRSSHVQGYELWQGKTLIHRHRSDAQPRENQIARTQQVHPNSRRVP